MGLIRDSGSVLLDAAVEGEEVRQEIREAVEPTGSEVTDLHVWQVGPGHFAAIVSLVAQEPQEPALQGTARAYSRTVACHDRSAARGRMSIGVTLKAWARRIKRDGVTLWFAGKHPGTPWYAKALGLFVVAYALSPIDLIPDFIPVLGYVDDVILLPVLIWLTVKLLPSDVLAQCRIQADEWMLAEGAKPRSRFGAVMIVALWLVMGVALWFWLMPHL